MKCTRFVQMLAIAALLSVLSRNASGSTFKVIYNFTGGQDGANPVDAGALAIDANGNLYGTAQFGGACGLGTLFELSPNGSGGWTETVLRSFCGAGNGALPTGAPSVSGGDLSIDTPYGGDGTGHSWQGCCLPNQGDHFVDQFPYECSSSIGCIPFVSVEASHFIGVTFAGGANGRGVLFGLSTPVVNGQVIDYPFCSLPGCADGANPAGVLAFDNQVNVYGMTRLGGASDQGVVYECVMQSDGTCSETVLHSFAGGTNDGAYPFFAGLTLTQACSVGVLCSQTIWGTTPLGGAGAARGGPGYGTVFDITTFFGFSLVHSFNLLDGAYPYASLTNLNGTFYGTTSGGGFLRSTCCPPRLHLGRGTIYSLTSSGTLTTLHTFTGPDGALPYSGLVADSSGNLYGVTFEGGAYNAGVVYEITP